jgi:hypothetical protein
MHRFYHAPFEPALELTRSPKPRVSIRIRYIGRRGDMWTVPDFRANKLKTYWPNCGGIPDINPNSICANFLYRSLLIILTDKIHVQ